jgi:hypothetical protein
MRMHEAGLVNQRLVVRTARQGHPPIDQGRSKNPACYDLDSCGSVLADVLAGLWNGQPQRAVRRMVRLRSAASGRAPARTRQRPSLKVTSRM